MATLHALPFSLQSQVGFPSLEATLLGANANIIHIIDMDTSRCFPMPPLQPLDFGRVLAQDVFQRVLPTEMPN